MIDFVVALQEPSKAKCSQNLATLLHHRANVSFRLSGAEDTFDMADYEQVLHFPDYDRCDSGYYLCSRASLSDA